MSKKKPILFPTFFLIIVSIVLGVILGFINEASKEQIEINYFSDLQKALLYTVSFRTKDLEKAEINDAFKLRFTETKYNGLNYYTYSEDNETIGYCFPFSGKGLWGNISGYIAIDKDGERIIGLVFTKHSETPGLGGRIEEVTFTGQFRNLDISGTEEYVRYGKYNGKTIDAISGATLTSTSVREMLNNSIQEIKSIMSEVGFND